MNWLVTSVKKYEAIGERLRRARLALRPSLSVKEYTKFLGLGYTQYINWESGLNRPLPHQAEKLCDKLGLDMDFIYRGREAALPENITRALAGIPLDNANSKSNDTPD